MNRNFKISAAVICYNEEHNIEACLQSVSWCDEIVVVDSGSTDHTVKLAKKYASRVIHHSWEGYIGQKNFALAQATGDWILCLDADERCTPELRDALLRQCGISNSVVGLQVRRHVKYLGRWIDHGGWYPDWKLRVVQRGRARWTGIDPHDTLVADGAVERLDAELHHFTYRDFAGQIRTINHFSDVVAEEWVKSGKRFSLLAALVHPPAKFFECYIWKRGFLDGWPGFVIAIATSFYVFVRYVKLWEERVKRKSKAD